MGKGVIQPESGISVAQHFRSKFFCGYTPLGSVSKEANPKVASEKQGFALPSMGCWIPIGRPPEDKGSLHNCWILLDCNLHMLNNSCFLPANYCKVTEPWLCLEASGPCGGRKGPPSTLAPTCESLRAIGLGCSPLILTVLNPHPTANDVGAFLPFSRTGVGW